MDSDFMVKMLRLNDEILSKAKERCGSYTISGSVEFREDGILVLDMVHPAQITVPNEDKNADPVYDYEIKTVHEEYSYIFKDGKLYVEDQIVSYKISNVNTLALNGNSRTLVAKKAK